MRPADTASAVDRPPPASTDPPRRRPRRWSVVAGAAALAVVVMALALWWLLPSAPPPLTPADVDLAVQQGLEQAREQERNSPPDASTAYQAINPSLVGVTTLSVGGPEGPGVGLGSGVIVNAEGAVLTALHVVAGGGPIEVQFADGSSAAARVAASQPETDIAVLVVDRLPQVVVPAVLAGPPAVGDAVFAVGNPLGLQRSLTAGVVSATGRQIGTAAGPDLTGLIQFDAAVNPGNSGGPLLNRDGQVVGIVTALANPAQQNFFVGIGFAVPIATAAGGAGGPPQ